MKALVLAAGLGTRLRPYTEQTPKPLFTLDGQPLLGRVIHQLIAAGAQTIAVNTHHLAGQIEAYVARANFKAEIILRHEPEILGTGGAIANTADILGDKPFMVVNSDIATDIDLAAVYRFHAGHDHPATLVLCDDPDFNTVSVDAQGYVTDFSSADHAARGDRQRLTFTGIQVLDPAVIEYIPPVGFSHSVDAFKSMLAAGFRIKAFIAKDNHWSDVGSPQRYRRAGRDIMAAAVFKQLAPASTDGTTVWKPLAGDGSDRRWYRLHQGDRTVVMVDHGLRAGAPPGEADAFVNIGRHLHRRGLPVPRILRADPFAGLVFVEDRGDCHLQTRVSESGSPGAVIALYRKIIDLLVDMSVSGGNGFDPDWTWQTAAYDRQVIVEKECRYFIEAFVRDYCGREIPFARIEAESHRLADGILAQPADGFMHRDFQSRNILIAADQPWIIDYQGGRLGPAEYDLASLLIDPYVALPETVQETLLEDFIRRYRQRTGKPRKAIATHFRLCAVARNLQILGAFGFLVKVGQKGRFAAYIPGALASLQRNLDRVETTAFPLLRELARSLVQGL